MKNKSLQEIYAPKGICFGCEITVGLGAARGQLSLISLQWGYIGYTKFVWRR